MRIPAIQGIIRRRILVNFRVDPEIIQRQLPPRFRPKLWAGWVIAGICLIRLEHMRPKAFQDLLSVSSENGAHRFAVLWEEDKGETREGVFIPRRDTDSRMNHLLGGRVFPGQHHRASFDIKDNGSHIELSMTSRDASVAVRIAGDIAEELPVSSVFPSVALVSAFFEAGSLGFSVTRDRSRLDGLRLKTDNWKVEPLTLSTVYSSYFANALSFPKGSIEFDNALIMRNIFHEWRSAPSLYI
jgi:hypothetical protein